MDAVSYVLRSAIFYSASVQKQKQILFLATKSNWITDPLAVPSCICLSSSSSLSAGTLGTAFLHSIIVHQDPVQAGHIQHDQLAGVPRFSAPAPLRQGVEQGQLARVPRFSAPAPLRQGVQQDQLAGVPRCAPGASAMREDLDWATSGKILLSISFHICVPVHRQPCGSRKWWSSRLLKVHVCELQYHRTPESTYV